MRRIYLPIALGLLLIAAPLCWAQTDADDVKAALDGLLTSAKAQDADAAAKYLHELHVSYMDPDDGMRDRQGLLDSIRTDPPPAGMAFGDYEPKIYGNAACVLAPLSFPAGQGPPPDIDVRLGAMLLKGDAGWQVLAMCVLAPDFIDMVPDEQKAEAQALAGALEGFGQQLGDVGAEGDLQGFLDLCLPEAAIAGPYGPEGAVVPIRASDLAPMAANAPKTTMAPTDDPNPVSLLGPGCAWMAITATVEGEGTPARVGRHIAIVCYIPDQQACKIIAALEAPLPK